jgi:hypothetical protein
MMEFGSNYEWYDDTAYVGESINKTQGVIITLDVKRYTAPLDEFQISYKVENLNA